MKTVWILICYSFFSRSIANVSEFKTQQSCETARTVVHESAKSQMKERGFRFDASTDHLLCVKVEK